MKIFNKIIQFKKNFNNDFKKELLKPLKEINLHKKDCHGNTILMHVLKNELSPPFRTTPEQFDYFLKNSDLNTKDFENNNIFNLIINKYFNGISTTMTKEQIDFLIEKTNFNEDPNTSTKTSVELAISFPARLNLNHDQILKILEKSNFNEFSILHQNKIVSTIFSYNFGNEISNKTLDYIIKNLKENSLSTKNIITILSNNKTKKLNITENQINLILSKTNPDTNQKEITKSSEKPIIHALNSTSINQILTTQQWEKIIEMSHLDKWHTNALEELSKMLGLMVKINEIQRVPSSIVLKLAENPIIGNNTLLQEYILPIKNYTNLNQIISHNNKQHLKNKI
jgi:hypothetical protein